jgi:MGT family glycosyltransferase
VDERLAEIFEELRPDVIVEDNVVAFPAVVNAKCPWVRIMSCNPLELPDPDLPPVFSGYPANDRSGWDEFREEYRRTHADMHADFDEFVQSRGCRPLPELEFIHRSEYLNLFLYPAEADYERARPLGNMWERLDSCVRTERDDFDEPEGEGRLVYLSLGSLGSADVELMQRLVDLLAAGGYRAVVSKGPQHDQIELREGQTGAELVPQPALLPHVDAVITHGGNNTVTECLHFGKPMVVLPLFWDQYDNAQRMDELGLGVRLPTFEFEDAELGAAIDRLAGDEALADRLRSISKRLHGAPGTEKAADCIEATARRRTPSPHAPPEPSTWGD